MFDNYFAKINRVYGSDKGTEHSYRPALQEVLCAILPDMDITNDPKRQACGAPDFIVTQRKNKIDIGYIETKDIGADLDKVESGEQLMRYRKSLGNLILTDYLEFRFYVQGEKTDTIVIAEKTPSGLIAKAGNYDRLKNLLISFSAFEGQTITTSEKLATMMAQKAILMRDVFAKVVVDKTTHPNTLRDQWASFKEILLHDMTEAQFADVYAQTVAYGLFTARLHDESREEFTRAKAMLLIPPTNPFLQKLFHYVAGSDLDSRAVWIVDALCEVFRYADLEGILKDFGKIEGKDDPVLHFYETFLTAYDPELRKSRGVWYTPEPVVRFIVRAIDEVLRDEFGIQGGITDTKKIKVKIDGHAGGKTTKIEQEFHQVQLLDIAAGTGTFLAEIITQIRQQFTGQEGAWSDYVDNHLLPRLHGFEILMAPYAMCHTKLDLLLKQTGYKPTKAPKRLGVYLTNSLEEFHKDSHLPFASWLSQEANEASRIKRDIPIMVALGNPPYSGHSANKGVWIERLLDVYKKEPGGTKKLQEKNPKWINDDYVKFIRLGENFVEKNGKGIMAYITNHGYLDNPTFRGMRWQLMQTFDAIYVLDLHGNAKKKETAPDGSPDHNVFNIQQGAAIIIAWRNPSRKDTTKSMAKVYHADLWGVRAEKFSKLNKYTMQKMKYKKLNVRAPFYFFIPQNYSAMGEYQKGFSIQDLFSANSVGIVTARDHFTIHEKREDLIDTMNRFVDLSVYGARVEFKLGKDSRDWQVELAQNELKNTRLKNAEWDQEKIQPIAYRPFDHRWTYYTGQSKGFHCMPRGEIMRNFLTGGNLGLMVAKQQKSSGFCHVLCHTDIVESSYVSNRTSEIGYSFPLYIYEKTGDVEEKRANLDSVIYQEIKKTIPNITPEKLFDYIYAVLHSRIYRERYAEFLKSDFPRVPYPTDKKMFEKLAGKGAVLRELHLMQSPIINKLVTTYSVSGNNEVVQVRWEGGTGKKNLGRVYINPTQYFDNVPLVAWDFWIGGYQPAQKWLKDRKGRRLSADDIRYYQRVIASLAQTDMVMGEIEGIDFIPDIKE